MKKLIMVIPPFVAILLSCTPDIDFGNAAFPVGFGCPGKIMPPNSGTLATFMITDNGNNYEIIGDAYFAVCAWQGGSDIHNEQAYWSYDFTSYDYKMECFGQGKSLTLYLYGILKKGIYTGFESIYSSDDKSYFSYHFSDSLINQQLGTTVNFTKMSNGRMDGIFTGKYYQAFPATNPIKL